MGDERTRTEQYRIVLAELRRPHNDHNKILRRRFPVVVAVRCKACPRQPGRVLGECYGTDPTTLTAVWGPTGHTAMLLAPRSGSQRWRCPCGADHPVSGTQLATKFPTAAAELTKADRVIWLGQNSLSPNRRPSSAARGRRGGGRSRA